jgi:hypothetical protein
MGWKENAIMYWSSDGGTNWNKISDHNRQPLSISIERFEKKNRMADGTLRRYSVAKKRTFSVSWDMFPSKITPSYAGHTGLGTVDAGWAGEDIETFHNTVNGAFLVKLRKGVDEAKAANDGTLEVVTVMISEFSKDILKRGTVDFWSLNITLEEV